MALIGPVGEHAQVEDLERTDVNGRPMFRCNACKTFARDKDHFLGASVPCQPLEDCHNCKALNGSHEKAPVVPAGGTCNDATHECPKDGRRWWQSNSHFHHWQQVTDDAEWETVTSWGTERDQTPGWMKEFYGDG